MLSAIAALHQARVTKDITRLEDSMMKRTKDRPQERASSQDMVQHIINVQSTRAES